MGCGMTFQDKPRQIVREHSADALKYKGFLKCRHSVKFRSHTLRSADSMGAAELGIMIIGAVLPEMVHCGQRRNLRYEAS